MYLFNFQTAACEMKHINQINAYVYKYAQFVCMHTYAPAIQVVGLYAYIKYVFFVGGTSQSTPSLCTTD